MVSAEIPAFGELPKGEFGFSTLFQSGEQSVNSLGRKKWEISKRAMLLTVS